MSTRTFSIASIDSTGRLFGSTSGSIMAFTKETSALAILAPYDLEVGFLQLLAARNGQSVLLELKHKPQAQVGNSLEGDQLDSSLQATKARVERFFPESTLPRFRRFFASPAFNKLLVTCLLYFVARFHHEALQHAFLKAKRQHHERLKPHITEAKLTELRTKVMSAWQHMHACLGRCCIL